VSELRADGVGVVLTTHLMDEAEALADDVVIVDRGKVIAQGSVRDLVSDGGGTDGRDHEQTLRLEATPGLPVDLLPGLELRERAPGRYDTKGVVDPGTLVALTRALAERDVLASRVSVGRRTLEDVFLDLTGRNLR
jgi:ABC-2 type transport system ATP-binding protein